MQRHPALSGFSREHHTALSLAARALRAVEHSLPERETLAARLGEAWDSSLAPHFAEEEATLLPWLLRQGKDIMAQRISQEHELMRRQLQEPDLASPEKLAAFGQLLQQHVRYEERVVFPLAQNMPDFPSLAAVLEAR